MSDFEFTDRYKAAGIPYPNPQTMCKGQCEGMGFYPLHIGERKPPVVVEVADSVEDVTKVLNGEIVALRTEVVEFQLPDPTEEESRLWSEAHVAAGEHDCDGYHFIKCLDCNGTGKKVS